MNPQRVILPNSDMKLNFNSDVKPIVSTDYSTHCKDRPIKPINLETLSMTSTVDKNVEVDMHQNNLVRKRNESECSLQEEIEFDIKPSLCEICQKFFHHKSLKFSRLEAPSICEPCHTKLPVNVQKPNLTSEIYVCKICHENFKNDFDLKFHLLIHSNDEKMLAGIFDDNCEKDNLSKCEAEVTVTSYVCEFCGEDFIDKFSLEQHYPDHTKRRKRNYVCNICKVIFTRSRSLTKHLKYDHAKGVVPKPYTCELCSASYDVKKDLDTHTLLHMNLTNKIRTIHKNKMKKYGSTNKNKMSLSKFCLRINPKAHDVELHKLFHSDDIAFICEDCNMCFTDKSYCTKHCVNHAKVDIQFSGSSNFSNEKNMP